MLLNSSLAGVWTTSTTVKLVYIYSTGAIFVRLESPAVNPDACTGSFYYQIPATVAANKELYQMLLTAKAANQQVKAYVAGCSGAWPQIHHLQMF